MHPSAARPPISPRAPRTQPAASARRRSVGFTLVELLVALVILAVVAAMGWLGVSAMARARDIGASASERTLRLSALVAQWEQDLTAIYDSPQVPGLSFDGAALRIVRRNEGGVQVVVWSLRAGSWRRWASPLATRSGELQQAWLASQQLQGSEPGQLHLVEGVTGWQVYFWRGQGWSNPQSSGDLAISAPAGQRASEPSLPDQKASEPGNDGGGTARTASTASVRRTLLPSGVRLQLDLPEGRLQRDLMLSPQP